MYRLACVRTYSLVADILQAKRSADLQTSRLQLINMGLKAGQTACSTNGTYGTHGARQCCVDYELSQQVSQHVSK